jgi:glycosyltransferase involved in cell wall biosynthesis
MRVAFDYQAFSLQNYGGISRYFTCLANGLIGLQQQVKVFAPLHRNRYLADLPIGSVDGRECKDFPPKTLRFFSAYNHVISRKKIADWYPDVVHETYYSRYRSAPNKCQTVITVYDMIHELFHNEFSARDRTSELKKIAVERADHVICISENTKQDLIRLFDTMPSKISVVHLGFDEFDTQSIPSVLGAKVKPFLLYVGGRSGYKNFFRFLQAVASSKKLLKDFKVVAFGGGCFSATEGKMISELGFSINQVEQVTGDDYLLGEYYRTATALVYPSLYEGFGIPPLEAMAHNCPVISSNTSSLPEVIGDAAEFFNPLIVEEMAHAIKTVVYSDRRIKELQRKGVSRLSRYSWGKCSRETLEVYQSLPGPH